MTTRADADAVLSILVRHGTLALTVVSIACSGHIPDTSASVDPPTSPPVEPRPRLPIPASDLTFTVDMDATFNISRFIYGGNFIDEPDNYSGATPPPEMTFNRMGGNRLSAYNWENNYSNAGNDYRYQNDQYLSESTTPGQAVATHAAPSFARNQGFMATIPMLGYVAADASGIPLDTTDANRAARLALRFRVSRAFKGSALSISPNTSDGFVYQDEFVNWFEARFPGHAGHATTPIFYSLDNEPDLWHGTHKQIQSDIGDKANAPRLQTYAGLIDTSIVYARAVKSVAPNALVFGPAVATYAGVAVAGRYPTPDPQFGTQNFFDVYLDRMRAAESTYGRRLLDVLDLHWYPATGTNNGEITNDYAPQDSAMIYKRVQAPRSLWDPTYDEQSWVSGVTSGPVGLLPRLRAQIAAHYPGTKIAITEYFYGRGGDISGGIAQADVLGVFGREGVFAAAIWPIAGIYAQPYGGDGKKAYAYVFGAFRMFRNYDGAGGHFGDIGLRAATSDAVASSVYASRDDAGNVVIVAINKSSGAKSTRTTIAGTASLRGARLYTLTGAATDPVRQPDLTTISGNVLTYTMPPMSVSTIVITP